MKCRVRRNKAFKPINVRLRFDNLVEYECFKTMMLDYNSCASYIAIPLRLATKYHHVISIITGVRLTSKEVADCLKSMMKRISNKLPVGREGN